MFLPFFHALRREGVPVSLPEFLGFLAGVGAGLAQGDAEAFHHLARATMVKDERHFDRFDRAFATTFGGLEQIPPEAVLDALGLPDSWLRALAERLFSDADKAGIAAPGGFEALIAALRQRLAAQQRRHEGGSTWIGTAGASPFGAFGYNPEGVRIGQAEGRQGRAVKVWDRREFRDLDDRVELNTRAIKVALGRLRRWARTGAAEELDLDDTIRATARQGWLDLRTRPARRNAVKVLMFLDIGGSMDGHVMQVAELFSAARSAFRHLEPVYFHNCLYDAVWRDNRRRHEARTMTADLLRTRGADWRCIFVGDAAMSPYEITHPGGASEFWNAEPGQVWLQRARAQWPHHVWLNPLPQASWGATHSVGMIRRIFEDRMYPLTLDGLTRAMRALA